VVAQGKSIEKGLYRPNSFAAPIKVVIMGNVRPTYIKRVAMELVAKYPRATSADFENNKVLVSKLTDVSSIVMRNRIAGYISRYWQNQEF
jgi:small subunit ribosomal protein S17e